MIMSGAGLEGFRGLVQEVLSPVVAVVSTPEADAIIESNDGLTVAELFRPFGQFHNLNSGVGGACAGGAGVISRVAGASSTQLRAGGRRGHHL